MNEPRKILNAEQTALVAELVDAYGIEPEQIAFYDDTAKPFLFYEANAALCNQLTNLAQIGVEPVASQFDDAVAVKCTILTVAGREVSAVGVANLSEKIEESGDISYQQAINLASSRALRSVLRAAGIDLIKLHRQAMTGEVLGFKPKSNYTALLGQAHKLGADAGLIVRQPETGTTDKSAWYRLLKNRYVAGKSSDLSETQLADFVAVLNTLVPQQSTAA